VDELFSNAFTDFKKETPQRPLSKLRVAGLTPALSGVHPTAKPGPATLFCRQTRFPL
jgi:hypothetical protein